MVRCVCPGLTTVQVTSLSVVTVNVLYHNLSVIWTMIAVTVLTKIQYYALITLVTPNLLSVVTDAVSHRDGDVTMTTTAEITQMNKTAVSYKKTDENTHATHITVFNSMPINADLPNEHLLCSVTFLDAGL